MRIAAAVLVFVGLAACADPPPTRLDGSSPEAFAATAAAARDDLPVADRGTFDEALNTVSTRRYGNRDPGQLARTSFNGMTAADVVASQRERTAGDASR